MTIALVLIAAAPAAAAAPSPPQVRLLLLPPQTTVRELADLGFSPGVMSPGLGTVPANQTYLDIGQGNRVFDSLYDAPLPRSSFGGGCPAWKRAVRERAASAPADIVPFLLFEELRSHGIGVFSAGGIGCRFGAPGGEVGGAAGDLFVWEARPSAARRAVESLRGRDLAIAIARPTGESHEALPIGVAGRGYYGNLTSASTRIDGYVLSTDVAPTILRRFGISAPAQMAGRPIRAAGAVNPERVEALAARMGEISSRRGPAVALPVGAWLLAALFAAAAGSRAVGRGAARLFALSLVYLPLLLLLGAALEPAEAAEALLVAVGAPVLGAATLAALPGYRALGAAAAVTAIAYAFDLVAGSPLTSLSLLGPNPGLGVRFYGIGNELEALLAVLVVAGTGAILTGFAPRASERQAVGGFLLVGLLAAFVFAVGRFGADVGAAIVFPVGAVTAAVVLAGRGRWTAAVAVVAAPVAVLALAALVDLLSGADAHLTRSVLDAGGLGELADVAERRLRLSVHSFGRPVLLAFLPIALGAGVLAYLRRDRLAAWLEGRAAMRAGLLGALAATVVGTLANDSGALLLEIGAAYLLAFLGFVWAESDGTSGSTDPQTKSYTFVTHT
jgi:hypothetical protein